MERTPSSASWTRKRFQKNFKTSAWTWSVFPRKKCGEFRRYIRRALRNGARHRPVRRFGEDDDACTLAINEIKSDEDKIITIEDPVEYQVRGITQIPVNEKKGLTFARGLRSILRHDPDKIMVGEIRDNETAQIAIQSALTGHLVFTTVHAKITLPTSSADLSTWASSRTTSFPH